MKPAFAWLCCVLVAVALVCCGPSPKPNGPGGSMVYAVREAYDVYAALFRKELFSKGDYRPVILQETRLPPRFIPIRKCLSNSDFFFHWSLVVDFERVSVETRLLAPERFHLNGPYDLVSGGEMDQFFVGGKDWDDFYRRFPKSR